MSYEVHLTRKAEKQLKQIGGQAKRRVNNALKKMIEYYEGKNEKQPDIKMLHGKYKGILRLRVGDLRVLFKIDNEKLIILIIDIVTRGDAYKN